MDPNKRRDIAQWRMSILGPLVSARLEHGDLRELLEAAASHTYETPTGRRVRLQWRTLEGWYYAYKREGLAALEPRPRRDAGVCRAIAPETAAYLVRLREEEPRRSARVLIRAARRAKVAGAEALTKSSVVRLLRARGLSQRPRATPKRERRAFTVELPGDLWMGDAMHGPPVLHHGVLHKKAYMLSQIDVASRFVINSDFYVHEAAEYQEDGLRRAITGHGLPREYYVDRGSAYKAHSLKTICAELGIHLLHAPPGDGAAKGVIERYHKLWRAEVGIELPSAPLPLLELRERHIAWVTCEYNRRVHGTTGQTPLEHFLSGCNHMRPVPTNISFESVFLHRETRKVRNDSTVRWGGGFLEVPGEYVGEKVDLRFAPLQPERPVMLYEGGRYVCDAHPLDRLANNKRRRRTLPQQGPAPQRTLRGPLDLITDEYRDLVAGYDDDLADGYMDDDGDGDGDGEEEEELP